MDFWLDFASFALKSFWIAAMIAVPLIAVLIFVAMQNHDEDDDGDRLKIVNLNERYHRMQRDLAKSALSKKDFKKFSKTHDKKQADTLDRKNVYVIDFDGESKPKDLEAFGRKITAVLTLARPQQDEVVVKITSPGGSVTAYGLAAMQMQRIRQADVALTACVDQVAASGGYLMAVPAHKILAGAFAVVGSIGVVAQVPNVHRLLKKIDVDYEEMTAGANKRPVSIFGPVTEEGRDHFRNKLEEMHVNFKDFVKRYRPGVDLNIVADGDFWSGTEALGLGLIDEINSSDNYLYSLRSKAQLISLDIERKKLGVTEMINKFFFSAFSRAFALFFR